MNGKRESAEAVAATLEAAGHRALFAGGCVRDHLLGLEPQDWDIATSAPPETVLSLFPRTVPVGAKFGVVLVVHDGGHYEVTTFRSESDYADGRHPRRVIYTDDPQADACRRDFTINGLYMVPSTGEILDWVDGRADLAAGRIRAIGDPRLRFGEDYLRMLRAVRFAASLGFEIEEETGRAIRDLAGSIRTISAERIRDELLKILKVAGRRSGLEAMLELGLLSVVLPEAAAMEGVEQPPEFHPEGDVLEHTLQMLEKAENPSDTLALGILLHDVGKPPTARRTDRIRFHQHARVGAALAREIADRLRLSNRQRNIVVSLVKNHMRFIDVRRMRPSTLKRFLRMECFEEHLELHRLDCLASHGNLSNWEFAVRKREEIGSEGLRPPPLITGRDLMRLHIPRGPLYGRILRTVEEAQLSERIGTRSEALEIARRMWEEEKTEGKDESR